MLMFANVWRGLATSFVPASVMFSRMMCLLLVSYTLCHPMLELIVITVGIVEELKLVLFSDFFLTFKNIYKGDSSQIKTQHPLN